LQELCGSRPWQASGKSTAARRAQRSSTRGGAARRADAAGRRGHEKLQPSAARERAGRMRKRSDAETAAVRRARRSAAQHGRARGEVQRGRPKTLASGRRGAGTARQPSLAKELREQSALHVGTRPPKMCGGADARVSGKRRRPTVVQLRQEVGRRRRGAGARRQQAGDWAGAGGRLGIEELRVDLLQKRRRFLLTNRQLFSNLFTLVFVAVHMSWRFARAMCSVYARSRVFWVVG
jgi:hypothetical protein